MASASVAAPHRSGRRSAHRRRGDGFTLIEALVALSAVVILLTLTLPSLRSSRSSAAQAGSLANLRQHLAVFSLYNADFDMHMPYYTHPERPVRLECQGGYGWVDYFSGYAEWNVALGDIYYEGHKTLACFFPPGYLEAEAPSIAAPCMTPYFYSSTYLADPAYWTYDRRQGPEQWRATRISEVLHPSKKAVLFESWPYFASITIHPWRDRPGIGFADGSVRRYPRNSIRPGHWYGTGVIPGTSMVHDFPTMHTIEGVHGRDVD